MVPREIRYFLFNASLGCDRKEQDTRLVAEVDELQEKQEQGDELPTLVTGQQRDEWGWEGAFVPGCQAWVAASVYNPSLPGAVRCTWGLVVLRRGSLFPLATYAPVSSEQSLVRVAGVFCW